MKVVVYTPGDANPEHAGVLEALYNGIVARGDNVELRSVDDYTVSHIAVVFGVGKKGVPVSYARGEIIRKQKEAGGQVLVLEKGYVRRDEYYAAGWGGLNNRANFRNSMMPPNRWRELGMDIIPWKTAGDAILVCGQVPSDASVQNVDIIHWCASTVLALKKIAPEREVIFRPHPLAINRTPTILHATMSTRPLAEDLRDAVYVVTYNSNTGVDAILNGVPVYAADEGSMVWDIASHNLPDATYPKANVLDQWAHDLAYTQWTTEEMKEGLPWEHLTKTEAARASG